MNFLLISGILIGLAVVLYNNSSATQPYTGSSHLKNDWGTIVTINTVSTLNGGVVYLAFDGNYTYMLSAADGSRWMNGDFTTTFNPSLWSSYNLPGGPVQVSLV